MLSITSTMLGHSTCQHVYLIMLSRREKSIVKDLITNGYGASRSAGSFNTIHGDLATQYFHKNLKELLAHSAQPLSDIHTVQKLVKNFKYSQQDATISQLVEKLIKKLLIVFCMQRKLKTNILRLFSKTS